MMIKLLKINRMNTTENTFHETNIKPIIYYYDNRLLQYYGLCGKRLDTIFPNLTTILKTYMILSDNNYEAEILPTKVYFLLSL